VKNVATWHPGKLVLMWLGYGLLFWFLWETECLDACGGNPFRSGPYADDLLVVWAVLVIPGVAVTWRWLSAREESR